MNEIEIKIIGLQNLAYKEYLKFCSAINFVPEARVISTIETTTDVIVLAQIIEIIRKGNHV